MKTIVSSKGEIVLPAELRHQDRILPGQRFRIERLESGRYLLQREPLQDNAGVVDWLLACPEQDWFQPLSSQSTAELG